MISMLSFCLRVLKTLAGTIAALALFFIMVLTTTDVFFRYLLNRPIGAALELTEAAMAIIIFAALPLVAARGRHITVDLTDMFVPPWIVDLLSGIANLVCSGAVAVLAWQMAERMMQLQIFGETSSVLRYPIWPTAMIIALGTLISVPVFFARGVELLGSAFAISPRTNTKIRETKE